VALGELVSWQAGLTVPSPLDEVLDAFQALLDARRDTPVPAEAGRGNFRCERCEDCSHCRFCTDCTACEDCTYCDGSDGCVGCTHCKHCSRCKQTTHSNWSSECSESSYLTLCLDCKSCVQCFACVGLQNEEFCVLNEKLPRKAYFSRVASLRGALEERMAAGWLPPWVPVNEEPEPVGEVETDDDRTPVPMRPELSALPEPKRDDDTARGSARRDESIWGANRREEPAWGELRREDAMALRGDARRDEVAPSRGELRRDEVAPSRGELRRDEVAPSRGELRRDDVTALRSEGHREDVIALRGEAWREEVAALRGEASRREEASALRIELAQREEAAASRGEPRREEAIPLRADVRREPEEATPPRGEAPPLRAELRRDEAASRGDVRRPDAFPLRSEPRRDDAAPLRSEPARREIAPLRAEPRVEPTSQRAEADPRGSMRGEPPWMPPPPSLRESADEDRAGRSEITVDVSDDEEPQARPRGASPWSFADARRSRVPSLEPDDELIPEPPPFGSGPHPVAEVPVREEGQVLARMDEPTRRRDRALPVDPPRDRYAWSAQAEGTPVRMGWSVQAEGEPERLSWTSSDEEQDRLRWPMPEPRPSRWSSPPDEGPSRASQPRSDITERRLTSKAFGAEKGDEPSRPPTKTKAPEAEVARSAWPPRLPGTEGERPAWPKAPAETQELRPMRPPERSSADEGVHQARPPKTGWDDPPGLHRDPHEHDFDRRRRETAALPSAIDPDNPPPMYGRDRPFDPEPPLQLDVWSAYEHLQHARLRPDEQTEPDAPVARRGPGRADLSGAAVASDDPGRPVEARAPSRAEVTDEAAVPEAKALPRSLGVARRPERPAPPEPRERGVAMLRGRAPARPTPPAPARQPDAPSLRRARRPSRVRDDSTSEYLVADGPLPNDPERS